MSLDQTEVQAQVKRVLSLIIFAHSQTNVLSSIHEFVFSKCRLDVCAHITFMGINLFFVPCCLDIYQSALCLEGYTLTCLAQSTKEDNGKAENEKGDRGTQRMSNVRQCCGEKQNESQEMAS